MGGLVPQRHRCVRSQHRPASDLRGRRVVVGHRRECLTEVRYGTDEARGGICAEGSEEEVVDLRSRLTRRRTDRRANVLGRQGGLAASRRLQRFERRPAAENRVERSKRHRRARKDGRRGGGLTQTHASLAVQALGDGEQ